MAHDVVWLLRADSESAILGTSFAWSKNLKKRRDKIESTAFVAHDAKESQDRKKNVREDKQVADSTDDMSDKRVFLR